MKTAPLLVLPRAARVSLRGFTFAVLAGVMFAPGAVWGQVPATTPTTAPTTRASLPVAPLPEPPPLKAAPYKGVTYHYVKRVSPNERVFAAVIDLKASGAVVRTSRGGEDPDGTGPAATTLMPTTVIAEREKFDLAVNGDYFTIIRPGAKDAEGAAAQNVFKNGVPSTVIGPGTTGGVTWATPEKPRPALLVSKTGELSIATVTTPPEGTADAIAGNVMLVEDGKALYQDEEDSAFTKGNRMRHPRTAVGLDRARTKLILVVVDGRHPSAVGMNHKELARMLAELGAYTAVNLDGGGSSTFVVRNPDTGKLQIQNYPSDKKERSVANVLGVSLPK